MCMAALCVIVIELLLAFLQDVTTLLSDKIRNVVIMLIESLGSFFQQLSNFIWGFPMIVMLFGTHLFLTVRLRFPQRKIFTAIRLSVSRDKDANGDVSSSVHWPRPLRQP